MVVFAILSVAPAKKFSSAATADTWCVQMTGAANLANKRNFWITWPWLDAHHVGIETKACYEISWFPVKRKLWLSPANSHNNWKLPCTTNSAENKERRKQVRMVVGFVPGDSVPADEAAIGSPEFEE